jgi:TP901 family phage tail tape measure protein
MVVGLKSAAQSAGAFQKQMAEVNTIAKLSRKDLGALSKDVKGLSTEIGVTTTELTQGLYQALSAGIPADNAIEFLRIATKGAIGGVTDVKTAVDGMTTVINAWGMSTSDATKVADIMFQTVKLGKTTFSELSQHIGTVASMASTAGISFEEVAGAFASMTKKGLDTSKSAVQIRGIVKNLIAPNKQLKDALLQVAQAEGLADTSTLSLQATLEGLNQVVKGDAEAMNKLFPDVRALNGVLTLTGQNAKGASADLMAMANSAGAAAGAFKELADTDMQKLAKFAANMDQIKMSIGEGILPSIAEWAEGMNALIQSGSFVKNLFKDITRSITSGQFGGGGVLGALAKFSPVGLAAKGVEMFFDEAGTDALADKNNKLTAAGQAKVDEETKRLAKKKGANIKGPATEAVKAGLRVQSALSNSSGAGDALTSLQNVGGNLGSVSRVNKGEMLLKTQVDIQKSIETTLNNVNNKMKTGSQSNRLAR